MIQTGDLPGHTRMTGFGLEILRNHHGEADNVVKAYLERLVNISCDYIQGN